MAFAYNGAIIWIGDTGSPRGNQSKSRIGDFDNVWLASQTFAQALAPHSLCNAAWVEETRWVSENQDAPGVGADVTKKGILYYRDPDTLKVEHFTFPNPIPADIEDLGYGKRIKKAIVIELVGYLSTVLNKTLFPLYGVYTERT